MRLFDLRLVAHSCEPASLLEGIEENLRHLEADQAACEGLSPTEQTEILQELDDLVGRHLPAARQVLVRKVLHRPVGGSLHRSSSRRSSSSTDCAER